MSRISDVFQVRETGRLTVVRVNPEGVTDYGRFEQCCQELTKILKTAGCKVLRFDVEGIPFLASGVLGLLVSMRNAGVDIQIQNASEHVGDVLKVTKLDTLVEVMPKRKSP